MNEPRLSFPRDAEGEATVVPEFRSRVAVTAETPLWHGGAAGAGRRARASERAADLGFQQAVSDLRRDLQHAYYALLAADGGVTVAQQGLEQARTHRRLIDDLVQAGRASHLDQLQGDVEVEQASTAAADATDARDLAAAALLRVMGLGETVPAGPLGKSPAPSAPPAVAQGLTPQTLRVSPPPGEPPAPPSEAAALAAAGQRADIRALEAQVEEAEVGARLARAEAAPSVNLALGYALQTPSAFVARSSWNSALTLVVPLGMGVKARADAREAAARAAAAQAGLTELRQGAALDVRQALSAVRSAQRRRESAARSVAATTEALRISELRFQVGRATELEVAAARASLQQARLDELRALYDGYTARADLDHAMGISAAGADAAVAPGPAASEGSRR